MLTLYSPSICSSVRWRVRFVLVSLLLGQAMMTAPAQADPVTFNVSGEVTEINDPNNVLAGSTFSPSVGDSIVGSYTFDSNLQGFFQGAQTTQYFFSPTPPFGMTFQIGGTAFDASSSLTIINVTDNNPSVGDQYMLFTKPTDLPDLNLVQVLILLSTTTNLNAFDSMALPLVFPDISLFDSTNEFFLLFANTASTGTGFLVGHISSITPVSQPATLLLLGSGLVGLAGVTWSRHRRT